MKKEQGGFVTFTATRTSTKTVTFLKQFFDTNYTCNCSVRETTDAGNTSISTSTYRSKTISTIVIQVAQYENQSLCNGFDWYCCGY